MAPKRRFAESGTVVFEQLDGSSNLMLTPSRRVACKPFRHFHVRVDFCLSTLFAFSWSLAHRSMSRLSSRDSTRKGSSEADRREAAALYPPSRVNHLGVRKSDHGQRHKFVKTMTISFDKKDLGLQKVDKHWQLIEDAARQSDFSIPQLKEMLKAFNLQKEAGSTLVGPHTFRLVLAKFGIKDAILVRRLFEGFCGCGTKVDYRDLLCVASTPLDPSLVDDVSTDRHPSASTPSHIAPSSG